MVTTATEFETLERQFVEIIGDLQTTSISETSLREALRKECARAEAAEAARDAAERVTAEASNGAAAATAGATQAATALATTQDQLTGLKIQLELSERQKTLLEEKCVSMLSQISVLEEEMQQLKSLQSAHSALQRQYTELQERISAATEDARRETSRLETELRRVEKCAAGGLEIRERARLAAAAHARERRLSAAELQQTSRELHSANVEVMRLGALVAELQYRVKQYDSGKPVDTKCYPDVEALAELRSILEAERAGAAKLEQALAAALADNASLAAWLHSADNCTVTKAKTTPPRSVVSTNICQIDSFLAE